MISLLCLLVALFARCIPCYVSFRSKAQESNHKHNKQRNIKLPKTLFIVICLSFIFWLPGIMLYSVMELFFLVCPSKDIGIRTVLQLGKTLGNSVVYSCRMPMFKKALNRLLKRGQENIELPHV